MLSEPLIRGIYFQYILKNADFYESSKISLQKSIVYKIWLNARDPDFQIKRFKMGEKTSITRNFIQDQKSHTRDQKFMQETRVTLVSCMNF